MSKISFLIQCATPDEFEVLKRLSDASTQNAGKRKFFRSKNYVVLKGSVGKVHAASSCEFAIMTFSPSRVIDFGTCGALSQNLSVGDIVLANQVIEYDLESKYIKKLPQVEIQIPEKLSALSNIHCGTLIAGDRNVETLEERQRLFSKFNALAATWETSAIARICKFHDIPFFSFRVVTDIGTGRDLLSEYKKNIEHCLKPAAEKLLDILTIL